MRIGMRIASAGGAHIERQVWEVGGTNDDSPGFGKLHEDGCIY